MLLASELADEIVNAPHHDLLNFVRCSGASMMGFAVL